MCAVVVPTIFSLVIHFHLFLRFVFFFLKKDRCSHWRCSIKKLILKNLGKITGEILWQSSHCTKVKVCIKDLFNKCDQIRRIWKHTICIWYHIAFFCIWCYVTLLFVFFTWSHLTLYFVFYVILLYVLYLMPYYFIFCIWFYITLFFVLCHITLYFVFDAILLYFLYFMSCYFSLFTWCRITYFLYLMLYYFIFGI